MHLTGEPVGRDERDRQLPGPALAVAVHAVVPGPGLANSANIDLIAIYMTGLATLLLLLVPFIPGLRDIPRLIPVHRLIWRRWSGPGDDGTRPRLANPARSAPPPQANPELASPERKERS